MGDRTIAIPMRGVLSLLALALTFHPASVEAADRIEKFRLTFQKSYSIEDYRGFDMIKWSGPDCRMYSPVGFPLLPVKQVRVAVPHGYEFSALEIGSVNTERLKGNFKVYPSQPSVPLSLRIAPPFNEGRPKIYGSTSKFPEAPMKLAAAQSTAGRDIIILRAYPIQYVPASGGLYFNSSISFRILFSESPGISALSMPVPNPKRDEILKRLVLNPEDVETAGSVPPAVNIVKYLIITDTDFVEEFQPLADWHTRTGVPAEVITTSYIYSNYTGLDQQKKIQNCIRDYYQNKGLLYVLLGGDSIHVPDRNCYVQIHIEVVAGGTQTYTAANMPSDIYYSALGDDNWDDDGDGRFGELGKYDDEPGIWHNEVFSYGPDVFVGRVSVRTELEVTDYVTKVLKYTKDAPAADFAKRFLLSGNVLYHRYWGDDRPPGYDHDPVSDTEVKCDTLYNDYIAPYWSPALHKFYDTFTSFDSGTAGDYDLTAEHLTYKLNDGYGYLYMSAHGTSTRWDLEGGSKFYSSDASVCINSTKPTVIYTIACSTNAFDTNSIDPCLSEAFIRNSDGGAAAYVGCSRFAWGVDGFTLGPSMRFGAEFFRLLLQDNHYILGEAFALHKESFIPEALEQIPETWLMYGINLMGDPAMPLWTDDPSEFDPAYPQIVSTGTQPVNVNTGVSASRVCLWKDSDVYVYGNSDGSGDCAVSICPLTTGTMKLTITAQNYRPFETDVTVIDYNADSDADGLPDGFELLIVNDDNNDAIENVQDVLGSDDYDGDGPTNLEECIAGTDPTDPDSVFAVTDIDTVQIPLAVRLTWSSVEGRYYAVYYSDDTLEESMNWTLAQDMIPASGTGTNTWTDDGSLTDPAPGATRNRCYEIKVYPNSG